MLRVLCAALALAGAAADRPAPHHVVNLDLPPAHRWDEIGAKYSEQIKFTLGWVQQQTNNPILKPVVNDLRAALKQHGGWSKEWVEEMHGLARAANVTVDLAETANLFYEVSGPGAAHAARAAVCVCSAAAADGPSFSGTRAAPASWRRRRRATSCTPATRTTIFLAWRTSLSTSASLGRAR